MPAISAKVDQATYDAFSAICDSQGTNANRVLCQFIDRVIREPGRLSAGGLFPEPAPPEPIRTYLDEILKHARIAAAMSAALNEETSLEAFQRGKAEMKIDADRFLAKLKSASSRDGAPLSSRRVATVDANGGVSQRETS